MRNASATAMVRLVSSDPSPPRPVHRVELDLEVGSEPIAGVLRDDGEPHGFQGWIDLTAVIAAAHQAASEGDGR